MIYSEEYKEHIEYTFAAFCKVVLHNAAMTAYRDFGRKQKREVSLEYLMSETSFEPFTTDTYFEQYDRPTVFVAKGQKIVVASKRLADALSKLTKQRRNVLFLYFFFGYTDTQIGKEYGRSRSTANYWKLAALKQLRKEMERLKDEEQELLLLKYYYQLSYAEIALILELSVENVRKKLYRTRQKLKKELEE